MTIYCSSVAHVASQSAAVILEFNLLVVEGLCEWFLFSRKQARA